MKYSFQLCILFFLFIQSCKPGENKQVATNLSETGKDYPVYGGSKLGNRYSPLTQINPVNVNGLQVAWQTFVNNPPDSTGRGGGEIQCQPIVVNGILYGTTAELNVVALDGATGKLLWKFVPFREKRRHPSRGVTYWEKENDKRILFTAGYYIYALNAMTGESIKSFGDQGTADLRAGLADNIDHEVSNLNITATSPGVVYNNVFIIGSSLPETGDAAPGHIRAYDVLSGKLKWVFHTIPQPGEFGYETWPKDAYKKFGGTNNWCGMSLDDKRGVVYFGTGSPSSDYYGADREGQNLFANCILALDAETGIRKWHFQAIHHDLWDRDFPAPPNLTTINYNGRKTDVVVQVGKDGYVWVLDRDSGKSIFPVEEIPVPTTGLPGEHPYPTQPHASKPAPTMRQLMTENDISSISKESHEFVNNRYKQFPSMTNRFTPPSDKGTILFGYSGGAEWGGTATDPDGILYVNSNEAPWELTMIDRETRNKMTATLSKGNALFIRNCAACHGADRKGNGAVVPSLVDVKKKRSADEISAIIKSGNARMPAFPYIGENERKAIADYLLGLDSKTKIESPHPSNEVGEKQAKPDSIKKDFPYDPAYVIQVWQRFIDQNGYNAMTPPWGTLNAIDLNTGDYKWRVPLGEFPELTKKGIPLTGTETYGGPVVTASGLLFIASTRDERLRAIDKNSGKTVWEYQLPAGGFSTTISYEINGRQYIALAVGGGRGAKPGGWYMAFALK